jgi:tetratricopeptide (TPR) repeat protein
MRLFLFSAGLSALIVSAAHGAPPVNRVIYNVDDAQVCSKAPADRPGLKRSLLACDVAINDPAMIRRATLLMDRGVVRARLGDDDGALRDYDAAIAINARLGEAYVGRAGVLTEMKRYDGALGDIATAMSLGASNLYAAFYTRGVIAEERGDIQSAYQDYKQALTLNPNYLPAARELARFRPAQPGAGL